MACGTGCSQVEAWLRPAFAGLSARLTPFGSSYLSFLAVGAVLDIRPLFGVSIQWLKEKQGAGASGLIKSVATRSGKF